VLASAAIPGIFPAVQWDGRPLIDGGVSNNTPILDAMELGADRIYVLPTGNVCDLPEAPAGAVAMLLHAMSLLLMRRLLAEIEALRDQIDLIVMPPPCPLSIAPIDFGRSAELIRRGYTDGREYLEAIERGGAPAPLPMSMHGHRARAAIAA
jgi:NTE family protein